jgi:glycosyltransferase involved in cell wall biosynthesis
MKILYVLHSFPPFHWRGTEVYAMELATAMASATGSTHQPHVFYLRDDPEAEEVVIEDDEFRGLPVHRARMRIDPADPETYFFNPSQEAVFKELLNRIRPEVVHFLYYTGGLSLNLPKIAGESGAKVFITVTDFSGLCPRGQMLDRDGERCPGSREGIRCVPCLFDTTVFASSPRLDRVLREYLPLWLMPARPGKELELVGKRIAAVREAFTGAKLVIYPNANSRKLYHLSEIRSRWEEVMDYGIDTRPFAPHEKSASEHVRIGFVGQLLPHKGLHVLARALEGLPGDWRLIVYGSLEDPGAREYHESLRFDPERADFRGTFGFEHMNRALEDIDILVVPSTWDENCPLIVKYAMATGTYAVLADQPGMVADRDKVARARFFEPGDAESLRKALALAIRMRASKKSEAGVLEKVLKSGAITDIKEQADTLEGFYSGL